MLEGVDDVETIEFWVDEICAFQSKVEDVKARVLGVPVEKKVKETLDKDDFLGLRSVKGSMDGLAARLDRCDDALFQLAQLEGMREARDALFDAQGDDIGGEAYSKGEEAHDALNDVERALTAARGRVEGVRESLEGARYGCNREDLESVILEWTGLARKHGVQPSELFETRDSLSAVLETR